MNNNTKEELKKAGFVKVFAYEYYEDNDEPEIDGKVLVTRIKKDAYSQIINGSIVCKIETYGFRFKITVSNQYYALTKIVKCEEHNLLVEANLLLGEFSRLVNNHD